LLLTCRNCEKNIATFDFNLNTMSKLLELQNLKKYYATQKAVDDISFSLNRAAFLAYLARTGQVKPLCFV
jgi:ABC-2 type transport system ATP-binding protein